MTKEFAPGLALDTGEFIPASDLNAQTAAPQAAELRRLHAEIETLRADVEHKDKYAEQLGRELAAADAEARSLRTGYAAARLEIESLRAGVPTSQPVVHHGEVYAALPEPITYQIAVLKACEHGDALVGWRVEPSRQSFDASMRPKRKLYTEGDMHDFADRTHALRASHGQAPAAQALDDGCPHGSKHIVHDCMRCGAPVCCGKCCAEDAQAMDAREKLHTDVARAIWEVMREYEDSCDLELEDVPSNHQVWFCADAAIAAQQGVSNG